MGTTTISDAITHQQIHTHDDVVAFVLVDSASEYTAPRLLHHGETGTLKFASLPIKGQWDGNYVIPYDEASFASKFNLHLFQKTIDGETRTPSSFQEILDGLYANPVINGWHQPEEDSRFHLMVIKKETLPLLYGMPNFKKLNKDADPTHDLVTANALIKNMLNIFNVCRDWRSDDETRFEIAMLSRIAGFELSHKLSDFEPPLASRAFHTGTHTCLSQKIWRAGLDADLIGDDLARYIEKNREKPRDYDDFYRAMHETVALHTALTCINRTLTPSHATRGLGLDYSNIDLSVEVIRKELESRLTYCRGANDDLELANVLKKIETLKSMTVDFMKEHKALTKVVVTPTH
jgi:hypothetical protein